MIRVLSRSRFWLVPIAFGSLIALSCGGGDSPTSPNPAPSVAATPAPTPTLAPAPTPDPRADLAPGPVTRYTIKVRTVNNGERDAEEDAQGRWVVHPGERVDFDSTQKNANNEICQWRNDPVWMINGRQLAFEASNGIVYRRGSSQPFLLKLTIQGTGTFTVHGEIDGVVSNILDLRSR